jgi:hypothetical protein
MFIREIISYFVYFLWSTHPSIQWVKVKGKVVPVLKLIKHYAMKAYGGVDV